MNIAVIPNLSKKDARSHTLKSMELLWRFGAQLAMPATLKREFAQCNIAFYPDIQSLMKACDLVIAIGGDGTMIHTAKHACACDKPVLGINVGRLGYVAGLEVNELEQLERLLRGDYIVEERMMLEVSFLKEGKLQTQRVLNDAVIARGLLTHLLDLTVMYKNETVCNYRADGLIVSTPTGSTAYSFSAGGPVMEPTMQGMLLTPVCPHSVFGRTVVFSGETELSVSTASQYQGDAFLTLDGECATQMQAGETVTIRRSKLTAKLIKLKHRNFYEVAREKLGERSTCNESEASCKTAGDYQAD